MSDQLVQGYLQGKNYSDSAAPGQEQSAQDVPGGEPKYITQQEAEAMVADALRRAQSLTDKAENRIQRRVQEEIGKLEVSAKALKAAGHPIPTDALERAKQKVVMDVVAEDQGPAAEAEDDDNPLAQMLNQEVEKLVKAAGVDLDENDEEAKMLDNSSPFAFVKSFELALTAKAARLNGGAPAHPPQMAVPAGARLPAPAAGRPANTISDITDPAELIKMGLAGKKRR